VIPFNMPYMTGKELFYIAQAHAKGKLAGGGYFTKLCQEWLEIKSGIRKTLLTHSCTAALEMAALLSDLKFGDEVIMPSYTFVSTANAFVLRGAVPVFVDIRSDTLNIDESLIEAAITHRTRAIVPVHYGGVSCEMDKIMVIADCHGLYVIEDAAQGIMASYKGRALGSIGHLGCYSFHETKNVICGEGGALLINAPQFQESAEIIWNKGTNRSQFYRGEVDKYTWQSHGSSYLPSELTAAFLWAQFEESEALTQYRMNAWKIYYHLLEPLEQAGWLRRPIVPIDCCHNGHMFYILVPGDINRSKVIHYLEDKGINAVFHYVPLHISPAGRRFGRIHGTLSNTLSLSDRLIRLPIWVGITQEQQEYIARCLKDALSH